MDLPNIIYNSYYTTRQHNWIKTESYGFCNQYHMYTVQGYHVYMDVKLPYYLWSHQYHL